MGAGHVFHRFFYSGFQEIATGLQLLCCKLVDGGAIVANMPKYRGLVCKFIVCTGPATELVLALVGDDYGRTLVEYCNWLPLQIRVRHMIALIYRPSLQLRL